MLRSIKYELNPTRTQREQIKQTCGCCRLVYNTMLSRRVASYKENGINLSSYEMIKQLPNMKAELPFLKDVPSQSLQQAIRHLDAAFIQFFRNKDSHFPKFKKKGRKDSFSIPVPCVVDYDKWTVKTAKIGTIKIYRGRNKRIEGKIRSYTISIKNTLDRYYISILYETDDRPKLNNNKSVGIDLGIKGFAVLSDGTVFENQKYLKSNLRRMRILQRTVSRRYQKGKALSEQSNNYKKAIKQVAKLSAHIASQRNDYLHKISNWIATNYSTVCVETLDIRDMLGKHFMAKNIVDCGWGLFVNMLEYKCDNLVKVEQWYASSQTCSVCGYKNTGTKNLSVRHWTCPQCGTRHDRDLNAARNIEREGLSLCGHKVGDDSVLAPRSPQH